MIANPTVFVLGAGASMPYGFPSAAELNRMILTLDGERYYKDLRCPKPSLRQVFIRAFQDALRGSDHSSIDAFLEYRGEFLELGKNLIAYCLIQCEVAAALFRATDKDATGGDRSSAKWYDLLLDRMDSTFDDFDRNQVRLITYNYDRSLEQYLFTTIKNRYGKSDEEVARKVSAIPIVHVHGQLGYLEWQEHQRSLGTRRYESQVDCDAIVTATNGIKVIPEVADESAELDIAHEYLRTAEQIHFLGFGYHERNMQRLLAPFRSGTSYSLNARASGTCFGLTPTRAKLTEDRYIGLVLGDPSHDIRCYLKNSRNFLCE